MKPIQSTHLKLNLAICLVSAVIGDSAKAEFLFSNFLIPSFTGSPDTEYSAWDVFYSANEGTNLPDFSAPNGIGQVASAAGATPPLGSAPADPFAFWNVANPTITQTVPGRAFIIGAGVPGSGNIYSFSGVTDFRLNDTTPYSTENGTALFQFQTDGSEVDFESIRLIYNNGVTDISLPADEYIREYRSATSSFGGIGNRNALQWNLTGLGIQTYRIAWNSEGSSMSLQSASLDTAATFASVVPEARTWIANGTATWATPANWLEGTESQPNGNVTFANTASTTVSDSATRVVGELTFDSANNVTIQPSGGLTVNTGITTHPTATGIYTINGSYTLGAFNLFTIQAGNVVIDGPITGPYGLTKTGVGNLTLKSSSSFGATSGGVGLAGGTLRMEGANQYIGGTTILLGDLVLAADAPVSIPGSLGNASSSVGLGASSTTFAGITTPARLIIDGDRSVARNISFAAGTFDKRLGAQASEANGANVSGNVSFSSTSTDTHFFAQGAADIIRLTGNISGGAVANSLEINADGSTGTVIFAGNNKTYTNKTSVRGGSLEVRSGISMASQVLVSPDTANPATLTGGGTISAAVVINAGGVLAPGSGVGTLSGTTQTWTSGAKLQTQVTDSNAGAGIGWDLVNLTGVLAITATAPNPILIDLRSLSSSLVPGAMNEFSHAKSYSWKIAGAAGGITGFNTSAFSINPTGFVNDLHGGSFSVSLENSGKDLHLNFTPSARPLNAWLVAKFTPSELEEPAISGLDRDFDNDGYKNLIEYAFGGEPKVSDLTSSVVPSVMETGNPLKPRLTVAFRRLLDRSDINYFVKAGGVPVDFSDTILSIIGGGLPVASSGGSFVIGAVTGNSQVVTVADPVAVENAPRRFMIVEVQKPD